MSDIGALTIAIAELIYQGPSTLPTYVSDATFVELCAFMGGTTQPSEGILL
jgi:hypothetical protein